MKVMQVCVCCLQAIGCVVGERIRKCEDCRGCEEDDKGWDIQYTMCIDCSKDEDWKI